MGTIAENPPQPPTYPLSAAEFEFALRRGLGRALIHSRRFQLSPALRDLVRAASESSWQFDPQCEQPRTDWLFEIARTGGALDDITAGVRERFAKPLSRDDSHYDWEQACALAARLVNSGVPELRTALYNQIAYWPESSDILAADEIIELDGADGFLHVARWMGAQLQADPARSADAHPMVLYNRLHGDEAAQKLLDTAAPHDSAIAHYCRRLKEEDAGELTKVNVFKMALKQPAKSRRDQIRDLTATELFEFIESDPNRTGPSLRSWGYHAPEAARRTVESRLQTEQNPKQLELLLGSLTQVGLLDFTPRLLDWLQSSNPRIANCARQIASHTRHPELASFARSSARHRADDWELFVANFETGDEQLILNSPLPEDPSEYHWALKDLHEIAQKHPAGDWNAALLYSYANNPCQNCREDAVKLLQTRNALPDWVRDECAADAEEDVRAAVAVTR